MFSVVCSTFRARHVALWSVLLTQCIFKDSDLSTMLSLTSYLSSFWWHCSLLLVFVSFWFHGTRVHAPVLDFIDMALNCKSSRVSSSLRPFLLALCFASSRFMSILALKSLVRIMQPFSLNLMISALSWCISLNFVHRDMFLFSVVYSGVDYVSLI